MFLHRNGWKNHAIATISPVSGSGNLLVRRQLEGVDHTKQLKNSFVEIQQNIYLRNISSGCCRIEDGQLQLFVGTDDEDGAGSERHALGVLLSWVKHAEFNSELAAFVSNDGEWQVRFDSAEVLIAQSEHDIT